MNTYPNEPIPSYRDDEFLRKRRRRRKRRFPNFLFFAVIFILAIILVKFAMSRFSSRGSTEILEESEIPDYIDVQLIDEGNPSRTGKHLDKINDIVIHYVGNPGTTAQQNHDYYCNEDSDVSSHFIIGLSGEIIQCIPLDECSSASNNRNSDTVSIEVCHKDTDGKFNEDTYASLVKLTSWLCSKGGLSEKHIIRHYDITGKLCPLYFVEHEDAWEAFKKDVKKNIK